MTDSFEIFPVGTIRKAQDSVKIEVMGKYADATLGLEEFSHIIVFFWFHRNTLHSDRQMLRVHPHGDARNPLRGVFATRSHRRPNLIGLSTCRILAVEKTIIEIDDTDAQDGSPVIDIKPYLPHLDERTDSISPAWVRGRGKV